MIALALPVLLFAALPATGTGSDFQPLAVGNTWTYTVEQTGKKTSLVQHVVGTKRIKEGLAFQMQSVVKGRKPDSSLLYWTKEGLFQAESTSLRFTPALPEVKLPLKPGK